MKNPDDSSAETHPGYGTVRVGRVSSSNALPLFGSETKHRHFMRLVVSTARRYRDLGHDNIMSDKQVLEVTMTMAQWAAVVSYPFDADTPVTLNWVTPEGEGRIPEIPFTPRLEETVNEVKGAADKALAEIQEAFAAYTSAKNAANLRTLKAAIENAAPNMEYAADALSAHAEAVGEKLKADLEAAATIAHENALKSGAVPLPELGQ